MSTAYEWTPGPAPAPSRADIDALPAHVVGEILGGALHVSPRPGAPHAVASSVLGALLVHPFRLGLGGPGGWWIIDEPELSLGVDPRFDPVVPDLAGWRVETVPERLEVARFEVAPQWVCEVLSPSTQRVDRMLKLPFYARAGVAHVWLVDPVAETLEVFALREGRWTLLAVHGQDEVVAAEPFDAVPLALSWLWGRKPPVEGAEP